jgi:hypothetical protein
MTVLRRCAVASMLPLLAGCGGAGAVAASGAAKQAIATSGTVDGSFPVETLNGTTEIPFAS